MISGQSIPDERIDTIFADMDLAHHPGGVLLVVDEGEVVYKRGYGLADLEANRPNTPDTSFYLASVSKAFTAMAVMLLAERRALRYEDELRSYFPQFPPWSAGITVRHLMQHTSGLPDYFPLLSPPSDEENLLEFTRNIAGTDNQKVLSLALQLDGLAFPVGAEYRYSNTGYILLALIVEAVSGQSFGAFLKSNVFDPLGMNHTLVYEASRPALHNLAQGYLQIDGKFQRWDYPLLTAGDGGMFSTAEDLFRWDQALNTERLVPKAALEQAFTSGTTNDGKPCGYGFGWMTQVFGGMHHVAHGGSLCAYNNYIIRFLDTPRTVIVLTNHKWTPGPRVRAHQVAEILFGYHSENE